MITVTRHASHISSDVSDTFGTFESGSADTLALASLFRGLLDFFFPFLVFLASILTQMAANTAEVQSKYARPRIIVQMFATIPSDSSTEKHSASTPQP